MELIKSAINEKNIEWIAVLFGEWFSLWDPDKWIDHEKIYWNTQDLRAAGLWKLISLESFIELYCKRVCPEVVKIIRSAT
jgi:hypothetical protein